MATSNYATVQVKRSSAAFRAAQKAASARRGQTVHAVLARSLDHYAELRPLVEEAMRAMREALTRKDFERADRLLDKEGVYYADLTDDGKLLRLVQIVETETAK